MIVGDPGQGGEVGDAQGGVGHRLDIEHPGAVGEGAGDGAVVGEVVASQAGLGDVIITTQSSMNTPVAFAALAFISLLGLALFALVGILSRALVPWGEVGEL